MHGGGDYWVLTISAEIQKRSCFSQDEKSDCDIVTEVGYIWKGWNSIVIRARNRLRF